MSFGVNLYDPLGYSVLPTFFGPLAIDADWLGEVLRRNFSVGEELSRGIPGAQSTEDTSTWPPFFMAGAPIIGGAAASIGGAAAACAALAAIARRIRGASEAAELGPPLTIGSRLGRDAIAALYFWARTASARECLAMPPFLYWPVSLFSMSFMRFSASVMPVGLTAAFLGAGATTTVVLVFLTTGVPSILRARARSAGPMSFMSV